MSKPSAGGKNGGSVDFSGQDPYEEVASEGVADAPELQGHLIKSNTSNPFNGSGGSRKVIAPSQVSGANK